MDPDTVSNQSPGSQHASSSGPVNQIRIDLGSATIAIVISLMIIIAGCGITMGLNLAKQAQMDADFKDLKTQEWLTERRLMDDEAYRIINHQKLLGDDSFGPTGNLQRMKPR